MLHVQIKEDTNIFTCTVGENDENSLVLVCLNQTVHSPYAKVMTLWKMKKLARENKDYDCDPYSN